MIGILLITHAPLAAAFLTAASHVFRAQPAQMEAIDVRADQEPGEVQRLAKEAITRLDDGSGVIVLTDVMGGTPSNCTARLLSPGRVEIVAGISMPMLLRTLTYRNDTLDVVVEMAVAGGQSGAVRIDHRIKISPN